MNDQDQASFDPRIADWLEGDPNEAPDQALQIVLAAFPSIKQRHAPRLPWRFSDMTTAPKVAIAAVAVIAILVGGAFLLRLGPSDNGVGAPSAAPTPTPAAFTVAGSPGRLAAGAFALSDPFPVRMTMTIPDGWSGNIGGPYALFLHRTSGPGAIDVTIFNDVYADPCHSENGFLSPRPGASADDLVAALARMPSVNPTQPVQGTIGGQAAKQLTLTAPTSATCKLDPNGEYPTWQLPLRAVLGLAPGQQERVWILDVDGVRLVIDAHEPVVEDAALHAQIQSILDSIQIQPTGS